MNVIEGERNIMFDVDDTLVMWDDKYLEPGDSKVSVIDPYDGCKVYLTPHKQHIKLLKNHLMRGTQVFVWSQGGVLWAKAVVVALGLESSSVYVMSKPLSYVDDLPVQEWLIDRIYISPTSKWGLTTKE